MGKGKKKKNGVKTTGTLDDEDCTDDAGPGSAVPIEPENGILIGNAMTPSEAESSRGCSDGAAQETWQTVQPAAANSPQTPDRDEDGPLRAFRDAGEIRELENPWAEPPPTQDGTTDLLPPEPALEIAVPQQTKLRVRGMTCGKCVGRVQRHLGGVEGVTNAEVDLDSESVVVDGTATVESMCAALRSNGYDGTLWGEADEADLLEKQAAAAATRQWKLYVGGMTCIKCVGRVKRHLQSVVGVDAADVDLPSATAWAAGRAPLEALCAVLTENGYPTCEWSEEAVAAAKRSKAEAHAAADAATSSMIAVDDFNPRSTASSLEAVSTRKLHVAGMTCGKCIGRVKRHLESVAGVLNADIDLDSASAVVHGSATLEAMCSVLRDNGYEGREWGTSGEGPAGNLPGSSGYHVMDSSFDPRADEFNPRSGSRPLPLGLSAAPILVVHPVVDANMASTRLLVSGMTCGACVARVEKEVISALSRTDCHTSVTSLFSRSSAAVVHLRYFPCRCCA
jgi:copper ion binding protein